MTGTRVSAAAGLALAFSAAAAAQQPTNRDQSQYTELHPEGFPIRSELRVVPAAESRLAEADLVIGVAIGGAARAYPVNLMWEAPNEALNDELGGVAIAATWCPIAHSATVFERRLGGRTLELGALGLDHGVFQLYDRQTRSTWSQVSGAASAGELRGQALRKRDTLLTTWGRWRRLHPQTTVFVDPALPDRRLFTQEAIARITMAGEGPLRNEDLVAGVERGGRARAWLLRRLGGGRALFGSASALADVFDGEPVLVFLAEDGVTLRVLRRTVAGRRLRFAIEQGRLRDQDTGTVWDPLTGQASSGPLAGQRLEPLVVTTALWYAWRSQHPGTGVWTGEPEPAHR